MVGAQPLSASKSGSGAILSQNIEKWTLKGVIVDEKEEPMAGASAVIKGSSRGVMADIDGTFSIEVTVGDVLEVYFLGYEVQEIPVIKGQLEIRIQMYPQANEMDEVTVVGFAKQKKESVIASVSTITPQNLKVPTSNLTNTLGGRVAGIISYQTSGEPGKDNANFFIRGVTTFGYKQNPLILIDNIESTSTDLARLSPDDIASFSIMKDASATAIYGARGANGVILVMTKEGREGPAKLDVRVENSLSMPTMRVKTVDPITYMHLFNEAVVTRDPLRAKPYSQEKIAGTMAGLNPNVYPAVDWYSELFKPFTTNQRGNVNLSGGGKVARYYVSASLSNDTGILKVDRRNNYNNNINLKKLQLRSNVNINVTKTTTFDVRINTNFDEYSGPIDDGSYLYQKAMATNPVMFPKYFEPDENHRYTNHILYGNAGDGRYLNPYADMVKGYRESSYSLLTAQAQLNQKLDFITKGLWLKVLGSTTRESSFSVSRATIPFYYSIGYYDKYYDKYTLSELNPKEGSEDLKYAPGTPSVNNTFYFEASMNYSRDFGKHNVTGLLVGIMSDRLTGNAPTLHESMSARNLGLSGRFTYAYDSRYFLEANFGYNGSERFAKKERFGFFPSIGAGWIISNEKSWNVKQINKLKLKATYGLVGNDQIGNPRDRFFYISEVNLNNGNSGIYFGEEFSTGMGTVAITRYANENITWEIAKKLNVGVELGMFDGVEIQADYFREDRSNIFGIRSTIPAQNGYAAPLYANMGEAFSHGFEVQLDGNRSFSNGMWVSLRGNFTYATSEYKYTEEPKLPYPWLTAVGYNIGQQRGLIAERLFIDEADIANSPKQTFGDYMPGDIKYRDVNDDGIIDNNDIVPIGYPVTPEIVYGFGASWGFKGFDLSFFFQGAARTSFLLDPKAVSPFINMGYDGRISNNSMLQAWADSYWSESNRNPYAAWPRLSDEIVTNNMQNSTWFLRDGSYLRLKSVELGYTLPEKFTNQFKVKNLRIYLSGLNLLTFSKFKMWDVEQGASGLSYPIQKVFNIGLNVGF